MLDQGELFTIPNPCRGVCTSNNKGYCKGCLRSRKERFHWNEFTPFQQQLIINLCEKRRLKILAGPGEEVTEEETDISQLDLFLADTLSEKIAQEKPQKVQKAAEVIASESEEPPAESRALVAEPPPEPDPAPPRISKDDQFDLF
ncbi:DUF1289 domain-containing protein [Thalassolituus maritimus]|nr:DUF1289 domain-containing protein [Thalassolituus maritimus]